MRRILFLSLVLISTYSKPGFATELTYDINFTESGAVGTYISMYSWITYGLYGKNCEDAKLNAALEKSPSYAKAKELCAQRRGEFKAHPTYAGEGKCETPSLLNRFGYVWMQPYVMVCDGANAANEQCSNLALTWTQSLYDNIPAGKLALFCDERGGKQWLLNECGKKAAALVQKSVLFTESVCKDYCTSWVNANCERLMKGEKPVPPIKPCTTCALPVAPNSNGQYGYGLSLAGKAKECEAFRQHLVDNTVVSYDVCVKAMGSGSIQDLLDKLEQLANRPINLEEVKECKLEKEHEAMKNAERKIWLPLSNLKGETSKEKICGKLFPPTESFTLVNDLDGPCEDKTYGDACQIGEKNGWCYYQLKDEPPILFLRDYSHYGHLTCLVDGFQGDKCDDPTKGIGGSVAECGALRVGEACGTSTSPGRCTLKTNFGEAPKFQKSCWCATKSGFTYDSSTTLTFQSGMGFSDPSRLGTGTYTLTVPAAPAPSAGSSPSPTGAGSPVPAPMAPRTSPMPISP